MPFPAFSAGHLKNIFRCLFYQSPVLSASESDDYGIILKIKEILTQEHQYMAKNISVIARACSQSTVSKRKHKRLLAVKTLMTPFR